MSRPNELPKWNRTLCTLALLALAAVGAQGQSMDLAPDGILARDPGQTGPIGPGYGNQMDVTIEARNDMPAGTQGVQVKVQSFLGSATLKTTYLYWTGNDNSWSSKTVQVPVIAERVRLTFQGDACGSGCPDDQDQDRNAHIDWLVIDGDFVEAEDFDSDGGTDPNYPGAGIDDVDGRTVATLGNNGDWVEYDLLSIGAPGASETGAALRVRSAHPDVDVLVMFGTDMSSGLIADPLLVLHLHTDARGRLDVDLPDLDVDKPLFAQAIVLPKGRYEATRIVRVTGP